jgi:hypothetical protein
VEKERYIIVQRLTKAGLHAEALRHARLLCADVCMASCEAQARAGLSLSSRILHVFCCLHCTGKLQALKVEVVEMQVHNIVCNGF